MRVDFIADVICPWCYVGWRALKHAQALRPALHFETLWRPFLLNPETPSEGVDRRAYYKARLTGDPERVRAGRAALQAAAADLGAPLDLDAASIMPNTIDSHRLILWAFGQDRGEAMIDALFQAYFVEGRNLADRDVLASLGGDVGLDRALVRELLLRDADRGQVFDSHNAAVRLGVTGVPVLVFDNKTAALGADKPEAYALAMDKALAA